MSNMINTLNIQHNTQPKSSSQNNDKDRLKKIIEKHYQNDYEEDIFIIFRLVVYNDSLPGA